MCLAIEPRVRHVLISAYIYKDVNMIPGLDRHETTTVNVLFLFTQRTKPMMKARSSLLNK